MVLTSAPQPKQRKLDSPSVAGWTPPAFRENDFYESVLNTIRCNRETGVDGYLRPSVVRSARLYARRKLKHLRAVRVAQRAQRARTASRGVAKKAPPPTPALSAALLDSLQNLGLGAKGDSAMDVDDRSEDEAVHALQALLHQLQVM